MFSGTRCSVGHSVQWDTVTEYHVVPGTSRGQVLHRAYREVEEMAGGDPVEAGAVQGHGIAFPRRAHDRQEPLGGFAVAVDDTRM